MGTFARRAARLTVAAALGVALGSFVAVSIFADGAGSERIPTIGALLLAYTLVGAALGYRAAWWYGSVLALPGLAALAFFAAGDEGRWWYLPYAALVAALPIGGAYGGERVWRGRHRGRGTAAFAGRGRPLD